MREKPRPHAPVEIAIELAEESASYRPSASVEGALKLDATIDLVADPVELSLVEAVATPRGTVETCLASRSLGRRSLSRGEEARLPFSFEAPTTRSYSGELVRIEHALVAETRARGLSSTARLPIVVAERSDGRVHVTTVPTPEAPAWLVRLANGLLWTVLLGLGIAAAVKAASTDDDSILAVALGWNGSLAVALLGVLRFALLGRGVVGVEIRRRAQDLAYREAQQDLLECRVRIESRLLVERIEATLFVQERRTEGEGEHRFVRSHDVHRITSSTEPLRKGSFDALLTLPVPEVTRGEYSFEAGRQAVSWWVRLTVVVRGGPEYTRQVGLHATPTPPLS